MPSAENSAGTIRHEAALARGTTTQKSFRELIQLSGRDSLTAEEAQWRDRAVTSLLGQLAVIDPAACDKIVAGASAAGRFHRSVVGIEGVLLSALLGSTDSDEVAEAAAEVWDRADITRTPKGQGLVTVLDPPTGELTFLTAADVDALTGLALRAQVKALCASSARSQDRESEGMVALEVITAATAVATLTQVAGLPSSHELKRPALELLGAHPESSGLARQIVAGAATLVEVLPMAPGANVDHPLWKTSHLCACAPVTGPGLAGQVVRREETLVLQALPRIDASGVVLSLGFMPGVSADQGATRDAVTARRSQRREGPLLSAGRHQGGIPPIKYFIHYVGGHEAIPVVLDMHTTGYYIPSTGRIVPLPGPDEPISRMRNALRAPDLSPLSTVEEVLDRVVQVDSGMRTLWASG